MSNLDIPTDHVTDTSASEPAAELLQDNPLGNRLPAAAIPVVVVGRADVSEAPPLLGFGSAYTGANGDTAHLIGAAPQRRRMIVSGTVAFILGHDEGYVRSGFGLPVPANFPIVVQACCDIWIKLGAGGTVGAWAEVDPG